MSKKNKEKKEYQEEKIEPSPTEKILDYNRSIGLLVPEKWKYPYFHRKKDYIAIIIGLSKRYEFERVFVKKQEYEQEERSFGVGFPKRYFRDKQIIEEKFSYKKKNTFITKINYYKIFLLEDGIYGEKISKSKIKDEIYRKQDEIYGDFEKIIEKFGKNFVFYTMRAILKEKQQLEKKTNLGFFSDTRSF
jgi:hypothetical protein